MYIKGMEKGKEKEEEDFYTDIIIAVVEYKCHDIIIKDFLYYGHGKTFFCFNV
jgi:hypothetical protein